MSYKFHPATLVHKCDAPDRCALDRLLPVGQNVTLDVLHSTAHVHPQRVTQSLALLIVAAQDGATLEGAELRTQIASMLIAASLEYQPEIGAHLDAARDMLQAMRKDRN